MRGLRLNAIEKRAASSLATIFLLRMLGLFMVMPVFAIEGQNYAQATPALIGLAIGAYGLTQALLQIPFGFLSDKYGRKVLLVAGMFIFALGSVVAGLADSIQWVIIGRAIQGGGAVSSVVLALASDVTRDELLSKVMALLGASIGVSFGIAFIAGPILVTHLGLSGLFFVTAILASMAIFLIIFWVPTGDNVRFLSEHRTVLSKVGDVLRHRELLRLDAGIFFLHLMLAATFTVLPVQLVEAGMLKSQHWMLYLPIMLLAFIAMGPFMGIAAKRSLHKPIFMAAIVLLLIACLSMTQADGVVGLGLCLFIFFWGFIYLEATLPSMISRFAPVTFKGTALGVYSTLQYLGVFVGGPTAGWLAQTYGFNSVFVFLAVISGLWLLVAATMAKPHNVVGYTIHIGQVHQQQVADIEKQLRTMDGVWDVVVVAEERVAYLKVDKKQFDYEAVADYAEGLA
tara:strand:+ start:6369 stop:7736 length:1368 start_codon:yes stop_codon:yes gene_type:complete